MLLQACYCRSQIYSKNFSLVFVLLIKVILILSGPFMLREALIKMTNKVSFLGAVGDVAALHCFILNISNPMRMETCVSVYYKVL